MLDSKTVKILLSVLSKTEYLTAQELASEVGVSEKTIRERIKALNDILRTAGANVKSKQGHGFILDVHNSRLYEEFIVANSDSLSPEIPSSSKERQAYILASLLNRDDYIKLDDLSDFLYVSRSTLYNDLKAAESILNQYNIKILRRPKYGIKLEGAEFHFRICIANLFIDGNYMGIKDRTHQEEEIKQLGNIVWKLVGKYKITLAEVSFHNFIIQIYVALKRICRNHNIDGMEKSDFLSDHEWEFINELCEILEDKFHIVLSDEEVTYIGIHLAGKRTLGDYRSGISNFVIKEEIDRLVMKMLELIFESFKLDFRNNLELRVLLNQHLLPMDIRLRYGIALKNPLLDDIKKNYSFAYIITTQAVIVLSEHYNKIITENEIGYIALIFALAIEKGAEKIAKKNILIVCFSGKGSAQLLAYSYKNLFKDYISDIVIVTLQELEFYDLKKVDLIFTTVPIPYHVPIPIFEVGLFLHENDIETIKDVLISGDQQFLYKYYYQELFIKELDKQTKEEVIQVMCDKISTVKHIPKNFYEAVMERERLGRTDFGNLVAMPHPLKTITEETFVCIAILKEPIFWSHQHVQVIFLITVADGEDPDLKKFYNATTHLMTSEKSMKEIIEKRDFKTVIDKLKEKSS